MISVQAFFVKDFIDLWFIWYWMWICLLYVCLSYGGQYFLMEFGRQKSWPQSFDIMYWNSSVSIQINWTILSNHPASQYSSLLNFPLLASYEWYDNVIFHCLYLSFVYTRAWEYKGVHSNISHTGRWFVLWLWHAISTNHVPYQLSHVRLSSLCCLWKDARCFYYMHADIIFLCSFVRLSFFPYFLLLDCLFILQYLQYTYSMTFDSVK